MLKRLCKVLSVPFAIIMLIPLIIAMSIKYILVFGLLALIPAVSVAIFSSFFFLSYPSTIKTSKTERAGPVDNPRYQVVCLTPSSREDRVV